MSGRLTGRDGGDLLKAWRAETTLHGLHGEREASPFCRRRWDHSLLMVELMALWPPAHLLILTGYRNRLPNWSCACTSPEGERFLLGWSVDWRFPKVMEWRKYKEAIAESREAAFFFGFAWITSSISLYCSGLRVVIYPKAGRMRCDNLAVLLQLGVLILVCADSGNPHVDL